MLHNFDTSSATIATIATIELMLLPRIGITEWKQSQKGFLWGTVMLFAVGISIGTALLKTNAAGWLANVIVLRLGLQHASAFVILMLLSLLHGTLNCSEKAFVLIAQQILLHLAHGVAR